MGHHSVIKQAARQAKPNKISDTQTNIEPIEFYEKDKDRSCKKDKHNNDIRNIQWAISIHGPF